MVDTEQGKLLYGSVTKDDSLYIWKTESGACEKCRAMDGKVFDNANEIPDKPHPNCKCWIDVRKKESKDPIQQRRDNEEEQKALELKFQKLQGDLNCLEDECNANIELIDKELETIEQFEYKINPEYLKPIDAAKIEDVKVELKQEKVNQQRIERDINQIKETPDFVKLSKKPQVDIIQEYLIAFEALKWLLNKTAEDTVVTISDTNNSTIYGWIHTHILDKMPESYNLFRIGLKWDKYDKKYIKKNSILLESIYELNNLEHEKRIKKRIQTETPNKNDSRILILDENSSISKAIENSYTFKNFIIENILKIYKNGNLAYAKIEFGDYDEDLYASFHGAEIYDAHFDNEGNLVLRLEDYYNFNPNRTSVKRRVGYKLQEQNDLIPYYIIVIIKISKDKMTKFKKNNK